MKKFTTAGLTAFLLQDVRGWTVSFLIGYAADSAVGKILREPGDYQFITTVYTVRIRDGALRGSPYVKTHYVYGNHVIKKKIGSLWKVIYNNQDLWFAV